MTQKGFLPKKGNYKSLLSYQKSVIIYDCTFIFCERFFKKRDRTIDQMVQAARSGKQNIIEGAKASLTSTGTEIKLVNVARASLEELLEDYQDFLRVRNFDPWLKNSKQASYVRNLSSGKIEPPEITDQKISNQQNGLSDEFSPKDKIHKSFVHFLKTRSSEVCANIMICLINQCNFLLDRQIKKLEENFTKQGGLRERMYNARVNYRKKQFE
jgi:four helix bundle suffix protein